MLPGPVGPALAEPSPPTVPLAPGLTAHPQLGTVVIAVTAPRHPNHPACSGAHGAPRRPGAAPVGDCYLRRPTHRCLRGWTGDAGSALHDGAIRSGTSQTLSGCTQAGMPSAVYRWPSSLSKGQARLGRS